MLTSEIVYHRPFFRFYLPYFLLPRSPSSSLPSNELFFILKAQLEGRVFHRAFPETSGAELMAFALTHHHPPTPDNVHPLRVQSHCSLAYPGSETPEVVLSQGHMPQEICLTEKL